MNLTVEYPPLTTELLGAMVDRILAAGAPQRIVVFGSRSRGDARADSDLDLLIIEESELPRYKRAVPYFASPDGIVSCQRYRRVDAR